MNKIIESAVMILFGLVILLTAIFTQCNLEIIVLGGLTTLTGIVFLVMEILNKKKQK